MPSINAQNGEPRRNRLLAGLPRDEHERLLPLLQRVEFEIREPVYEAGRRIQFAYFPLTSVFSLIADLDQAPVEVATIGYEGMLGLPAFLGAGTSPNRAFCQIPGETLRISTKDLRRFLDGAAGLQLRLHRFAQATIVQLAQNVACNRAHTADQRCARWLLQTHDRAGQDVFPLTQDFLAAMLGVRRATVSEIGVALQRAGVITYTRGRITILDRAGLEAAACQCYHTIRQEFDRLLTP
jgi:CRP-like cAMP-binding protein